MADRDSAVLLISLFSNTLSYISITCLRGSGFLVVRTSAYVRPGVNPILNLVAYAVRF